MRRVVRTVARFLVAGVVTTALVATVCAWRAKQFTDLADLWAQRLTDPRGGVVAESDGKAPANTQYLELHVYERFGASFGTARLRPFQNYTAAAPPLQYPSPDDEASRWQRAELLPWLDGHRPWPDPRVGDSVWIKASGWPFRCLICNLSTKNAPNFGTHTWAAQGGLILSDPTIPGWADWPPVYPRILPLRPMWPELAANSIFYGLCWWVLGRLWGWQRARRRRRRGRCIACGFDLAGLPSPVRCPECGWASGTWKSG